MIIKTIIFKRTKTSKEEVGIEIEGSVIIDKEKNVVPAPIWNAKDILGIQLDLQPLLESLSKIKWKGI